MSSFEFRPPQNDTYFQGVNMTEKSAITLPGLDKFFEHRPKMRDIYRFAGSFSDYAGKTAGKALSKTNKNMLTQCILDDVQRLLPGDVSMPKLDHQLTHTPLVSFADHHALLNYKLLYNSNILYAEIIKKLALPYILVFATGTPPLSNKTYPRGFYFKNTKLNFFTKKYNNVPVCLLDEKLEPDSNKGIESFILNTSSTDLTAEEKKFLHFLFFESLEIEKCRHYETFSGQITFLNRRLWKYYFDQSIRPSIPELLYLQPNGIITRILINQLQDENSLISRIILDPSVRNKFIKRFYGVACCWGDNTGSQLFWGITRKKDVPRLFSLCIDNQTNSLTGEHFSIALGKDQIIDALKSKKIIQTSFFDLLTVTFMEGYLTLGGFNQLEYLPQMQHAHVSILKELGMQTIAGQFLSRITNGFICGMFPFHFDSAIDMIWHYNSTNGKFNGNLVRGLTQKDLDNMLNTKLKDLITPAIATMLENMSITA